MAMLGAYCYRKDAMGNVTDKIHEAHPYEDVIDCLIYWFLETDGYSDLNTSQQPDLFEPYISQDFVNPYTGF
jgi:hypothetical protein